MPNQSQETFLALHHPEEKGAHIGQEATPISLISLQEETGKTINLGRKTGIRIEGTAIETEATETIEGIPEIVGETTEMGGGMNINPGN